MPRGRRGLELCGKGRGSYGQRSLDEPEDIRDKSEPQGRREVPQGLRGTPTSRKDHILALARRDRAQQMTPSSFMWLFSFYLLVVLGYELSQGFMLARAGVLPLALFL
jgi:hypothetical protein